MQKQIQECHRIKQLEHFSTITYSRDGSPVWGVRTLRPHKITPFFIKRSTLLLDDIQQLLKGSTPTTVVFYRPENKSDWPTRSAKPTTKLKIKDHTCITYKMDEDGLPILDPNAEENIAAELEELFRLSAGIKDDPDEAINVTSSQILTLLPDQSASLLHISSYYLTHDDLEQIRRVLKPDGRMLFMAHSARNR